MGIQIFRGAARQRARMLGEITKLEARIWLLRPEKHFAA